jgi:xanthine dehydrogenase molybdopterin-binding subunit B
MIETVMEHVATVLGLGADAVRKINMYKEGDITLNGWQKLVYCNAITVFETVKVSELFTLFWNCNQYECFF